MKKLLMTLALIVASQFAFSQTFDEVADQLKTLPKAEYQSLGKDMLAMAAAGVTDANAKKIFSKLTAMKLLEIKNPDKATRATYDQKVASFKTLYEKVAEENEEGQTALVYAAKGENGKTECVILSVADADSCELICFEGDIELSDIEALSSLK